MKKNFFCLNFPLNFGANGRCAKMRHFFLNLPPESHTILDFPPHLGGGNSWKYTPLVLHIGRLLSIKKYTDYWWKLFIKMQTCWNCNIIDHKEPHIKMFALQEYVKTYTTLGKTCVFSGIDIPLFDLGSSFTNILAMVGACTDIQARLFITTFMPSPSL